MQQLQKNVTVVELFSYFAESSGGSAEVSKLLHTFTTFICKLLHTSTLHLSYLRSCGVSLQEHDWDLKYIFLVVNMEDIVDPRHI